MSKQNLLPFVAVPAAGTLIACLAVGLWLRGSPVDGTTIKPTAATLVGPPSPTAPGTMPAVPPHPFRTLDRRVDHGYTLSQALKDTGLLAAERAALMDSLKPYADPARVAAGTTVRASYNGPEDQAPSRVELQLDRTRSLLSVHEGERRWRTELRDKLVEHRTWAYSGVVTSSLWSSAATAGMDPRLIGHLTEIFAWVFDFSRDVQEGDRWRLAVDRLYVDGQPAGWGDIVSAEYDSGGHIYTAVRYSDPDAPSGYYTPDGGGLQSAFLRSPLKYAHITSGFSSQRFHPILKVRKPHLGVDYGAPPGTPVMAVGDGIATFAANNGPSGNMIVLRHNGVYETLYKHLARFAAGITPGTHVQMGQVIGYVGMTGLATGPHLHFEFHVAGRVIDPVGLRFPAVKQVPEEAMARFKLAAARELRELPPWSRGQMAQGPRVPLRNAE